MRALLSGYKVISLFPASKHLTATAIDEHLPALLCFAPFQTVPRNSCRRFITEYETYTMVRFLCARESTSLRTFGFSVKTNSGGQSERQTAVSSRPDTMYATFQLPRKESLSKPPSWT